MSTVSRNLSGVASNFDGNCQMRVRRASLKPAELVLLKKACDSVGTEKSIVKICRAFRERQGTGRYRRCPFRMIHHALMQNNWISPVQGGRGKWTSAECQALQKCHKDHQIDVEQIAALLKIYPKKHPELAIWRKLHEIKWLSCTDLVVEKHIQLIEESRLAGDRWTAIATKIEEQFRKKVSPEKVRLFVLNNIDKFQDGIKVQQGCVIKKGTTKKLGTKMKAAPAKSAFSTPVKSEHAAQLSLEGFENVVDAYFNSAAYQGPTETQNSAISDLLNELQNASEEGSFY